MKGRMEMDDLHPVIGLCLICLLLVIKAIISNAKSAIGNVNESSVKKDVEQSNNKSAKAVLELLEKPPSYIYAVDIVITIISVLIGYVYRMNIFYTLDDWFVSIGIKNSAVNVALHTICILLLFSRDIHRG